MSIVLRLGGGDRRIRANQVRERSAPASAIEIRPLGDNLRTATETCVDSTKENA